jgi:L-gulonate 3-dehydrogenase
MHIAIAGAGLVGAGWTIVFARAGEVVKLYDASETARVGVLENIRDRLNDLRSFDLVGDVDVIIGRIEVCDTLAAAVEGAKYVQESVPERIELKQEISRQLSNLLGESTVVGSSTSGIPASAFTENLTNRKQFLVAHPVNPPYLVPVVEVAPAPWTAPEAVEKAMAVMTAVGQSPVLVRREIEGFILNRLQGVLLREAWALFEEGYASAEDIDKTVKEGLGLRWSFIGPFETIDLNAPGGVREYAEVLGGLYHSIDASRSDPQPWSEDLIANVEAERRDNVPAKDLAARRNWRDRRLMALAAHKNKQEC